MRAALLVTVAVTVVVPGCSKTDGLDLTNHKLTGSFSASHPELGTWTVTPTACESGREYGFQGVLLTFALPTPTPASAEAVAAEPAAPTRTPSTPPEEIRLDGARQGDNVVELRYPDRDGTVRRIRERECASITGEVAQTNITYNGRPIVRLVGHLEIDCPAFSLKGHVEFDGCLPSLK